MLHEHEGNIGNRFLFVILLNALFIAFEIFFGVRANAVILIADATHNAGDMLTLVIAWLGYWLSYKKAPKKFTYGFKNATVIAAFINAILIFLAVGGIIWESIQRLEQAEATTSTTIIVVASIGGLIKGLTSYLFYCSGSTDINIKSVFLHMGLDSAASFIAVAAGILLFWKSWSWIDPTISLVIALIILFGSWKLFKESVDLMLLAVPTSIDIESLKELMHQYGGLLGYHDLHVWPLSTTEIALSAHLVVSEESFNNNFSKELENNIKQLFPISHVTLQLELQDEKWTCKTNCP
jgi:cobalt-zinc-cadmium efflux system protein